MSHPEGNQTAWAENRARWPLLILVTLALGWILEPLSGTILWSAIIALLFAPVYRGLLARTQRRRTLAALVTLTIVIVIVIVPFALLTASLANEAATVYKHIESGEWNVALYFHRIFDALPDPVMALLVGMLCGVWLLSRHGGQKGDFTKVLEDRLAVMDGTAATLCRDNKLPILVFDLADPDNIARAVQGENVGTLVYEG